MNSEPTNNSQGSLSVEPLPKPTPPLPAPEPPVLQAPIADTVQSPQKQRPKIKKVLVTLVALLVVVGGAIAGYVWWRSQQIPVLQALPHMSAEQVKALGDKYGYDITYKPDILPTDKPKIDVKYDYVKCATNTCIDAIELYSDAALTQKVDFGSSVEQTSSLPVSYTVSIQAPASKKIVALLSSGNDDPKKDEQDVTISGDYRWGIAQTYFLVQRVDEQGSKLSRPKVTLFTVKPDDKTLSPTTVNSYVDTNGSVNFSWSAVKGAKEYYVVRIVRSKDRSFSPEYRLVAKTTKTSVNLADYNGDAASAEKAKSNTKADELSTDQYSFSQNLQLSPFDIKTEDSYFDATSGVSSLPNGKYNPYENGAAFTNFAVLAVNGTAYSALNESAGNALLAQVPVRSATNQSSYTTLQRKQSAPNDYEVLDTSTYVTMADGHTAQKAVIYDSKNAKVRTVNGTDDLAVIPYTVQGTYLTANSRMYGGVGTFTQSVLDSKIKDINARNIAAQPPASLGATSYNITFSNDAPQLDTQQAPTDMPSVLYPVNGTSDIVKFIAANMMAGRYSMDVRNYYTDPTIDIQQAFFEAIYQNPYLQLADERAVYTVRFNNPYLVVSDSSNRSAIKKEREELLNRTKDIVNQIITPNMTDRQKALAINQWLIDHASYDEPAADALLSAKNRGEASKVYTKYPYSWNAYGVIMLSKGVCVSYAQGFKILADLAGLKSIYVTGTANVSGVGHAWNKVYMDGKWQVVDVTWDDTSNNNTKYFGITDSQSNRVQDDDFIVKRFIPDYAAN